MLARSPATGKPGNPPHEPVAGDRANSETRTVLRLAGGLVRRVWRTIHPENTAGKPAG